MKKLVFILSIVLSIGFSSQMYGKWLYCDGKGQAWIMDPLGNSKPAGGCANGPWAIRLELVVPTGGATIPEASPAIYDALNTVPSDPSASPSSTELEEMNNAINNSTESYWINPLKLSAAAYAEIYGGTTALPLFYVNTSINQSTNQSILSLYSDANREITVTYKTLDLTVISSEAISVLSGSNTKTLNTASLENGTYIITISTGANYAVNLSLSVND